MPKIKIKITKEKKLANKIFKPLNFFNIKKYKVKTKIIDKPKYAAGTCFDKNPKVNKIGAKAQ